MQRLDLAIDVGLAFVEQTPFDRERQNRVAFGRRIGEFGVEVAFEQAELRPQPDVVARKVSRGGREVVCGHRGQAQGAVGFRPAWGVLVAFEPQDRRPGDPPLGEILLHPLLEDPEVLTNDHGAGAMRLERQDADECLVVAADVRAVGGRHPLRYPPGAEQSQDVIGPDTTRVPQRRAHHIAEGDVSQLRETIRPPRRLIPVLAVAVEVVGGAPTVTPDASASPSVQASAPCGPTPTARSCRIPISEPAASEAA